MKIRMLLAAAALLATMAGEARGSVDLQGTTFAVDTLKHFYIGPGVTHTHLRLSANGRVVMVYAVSTDVTASPDTRLRVVIGNDSCRTGEAVTSMARRKNTDNCQYIAGCNADFFITSAFAAQHEFGNAILGYPNMSCFIDGTIAAPDMIDVTSRENALIMGTDGWWIDATDIRYMLLNADESTTVATQAINYPRRAGEIMLYNSYAGRYTKTDGTGRELVLELAEGSAWRTNGVVEFRVKGDWRQGGNSRIPQDGLVISCGPNYHNAWVDGLKDGDAVKLNIEVSLPAFGGIKPNILDVVGGDVRILKENEVTTSAIRWINTPSAAYARSLVGYSQDRSLMVMAAVDGNAASSGVSYYEGADLMRYLGCYDALDFDGGGSTMIWAKSHGILNQPRDGSERAVGNGMFVTLNAPADKEVASIRFADYVKVMPRFGTYEPVIYGYNRYGELVDTDVKGFTLEGPEGLGQIDGTSLFADGEGGTFALTARLGGSTASIAVTVDATYPSELRYSTLLIDNVRPTPIQLQSVVGLETMPVAAKAFEWTSSDPTIVTVDEDGILTGVADGSAVVTGRRGDLVMEVMVKVECATANVAPVDRNFDASEWKVSKSGVSTTTVTALDNGMSVEYKITSTRGTRVTLARDIDLWSRPDAIQVRVRPADGVSIASVTVNARPDNQSRAVGVKMEQEFPSGVETVLTFPAEAFGDPTDPGYYPLHFVSLGFEPKNSAGTYTVDFPGVECIYNNVNVGGVGDVTISDSKASRLAMTCNGETITLAERADMVEVYNAAGGLVASARNARQLQAPSAHGVYVVRAAIGDRVLTAKAIF